MARLSRGGDCLLGTRNRFNVGSVQPVRSPRSQFEDEGYYNTIHTTLNIIYYIITKLIKSSFFSPYNIAPATKTRIHFGTPLTHPSPLRPHPVNPSVRFRSPHLISVASSVVHQRHLNSVCERASSRVLFVRTDGPVNPSGGARPRVQKSDGRSVVCPLVIEPDTTHRGATRVFLGGGVLGGGREEGFLHIETGKDDAKDRRENVYSFRGGPGDGIGYTRSHTHTETHTNAVRG